MIAAVVDILSQSRSIGYCQTLAICLVASALMGFGWTNWADELSPQAYHDIGSRVWAKNPLSYFLSISSCLIFFLQLSSFFFRGSDNLESTFAWSDRDLPTSDSLRFWASSFVTSQYRFSKNVLHALLHALLDHPYPWTPAKALTVASRVSKVG